MDLKSGYPFWAVRNGLVRDYPRLESDTRADVAIIGGGITGALIADELTHHGHSVVVIEQRDIAWGSTAASTALLQYEIDTHMIDLAARYGEPAAALAYLACVRAVEDLAALAGSMRGLDFQRARSLYLASSRKHLPALQAEQIMREAHGIDCEYRLPGAVLDEFGITTAGALISGTAAQVDPYAFAHRLFARVARRGGEVYDRTTVTRADPSARGITLQTDTGATVRASHLVVAAGYQSQRWLPKPVAQNRSSYAFVTDPIDPDILGTFARTMVWESARPYLYLRATGSHRLVIGGNDDSVDVPARRNARVDLRATELAKRVRALIPHVPFVTTFAWAGTFAETADGLPFFGPHPALSPRILFALAYGGNGITYSAIGAGLLRAKLERRAHPLAALFSFARAA